MTIFTHKYYDPSDLTKYKICEYQAGLEREVSEGYYLYQEWIKTNTPEKISGNRFISIVDGVPVVDSDMDSILENENKATKKSDYKNNARRLIEQNVGDDKDIAADISKRLDVIERGFVRLLAHVLGGTQMTSEYQTRYLNYSETIISLVESESYKPRADLENEEELVAKLIERQNTIGQIVKTEYLDKLKNEGLTE